MCSLVRPNFMTQVAPGHDESYRSNIASPSISFSLDLIYRLDLILDLLYRQMSVPEPHEAKEASSPIPKLGVSVSLLLATYQRWEAADLAADATTDDVVYLSQ
eukprot:g15497.t1